MFNFGEIRKLNEVKREIAIAKLGLGDKVVIKGRGASRQVTIYKNGNEVILTPQEAAAVDALANP